MQIVMTLVFLQGVRFPGRVPVGPLFCPSCLPSHRGPEKSEKSCARPNRHPGEGPGHSEPIKNAVGWAWRQLRLLPFSIPRNHPRRLPGEAARSPLHGTWEQGIGAVGFNLCSCHSAGRPGALSAAFGPEAGWGIGLGLR